MKVLFIVYDNASHLCTFPIGVAMLTAALKKAGHEVRIYNQDIHHYSTDHLKNFLTRDHFDLVSLSFIGGYWQYQKAKEIAAAINSLPSRKKSGRPWFAIGGHGPSADPEFFLKKLQADIVGIGEGEETIVELCDCLGEGGGFSGLDKIEGIAYRSGEEVHVNKRRPLIKDIDALPFPAYEDFPMEIYRLLRLPHIAPTDFCGQILSGRGCTFKCNFCYRMDKGFRPRSNDAIIDEIRFLNKRYNINYIAFFDELLMSSVKRTISFCEALLSSGLSIKWECNGRLNYAEPEVLELMKKSGCVFINYGIEAFDDRILKNMNKNLTTARIEQGIQNTLAAGISPGLNIIFGNIGENRETLQKGVNFLLKYDDGAQLRTIRPVTPYPGCELYNLAIKKNLIRDCEDFYENRHVNSDLLTVNFTELSDAEYYEALHDANKILLANYLSKKGSANQQLLKSLYQGKDASFRGFRHT